ncbi:MAG: sugar transferase, partial [Myxococcales bacterium]|nr:sugar transferase [Myxococcales bacterium]
MDWKTRVLKRAIDVAGASVGLALTAPLFPVLAAAVRLTSKGPVFY